MSDPQPGRRRARRPRKVSDKQLAAIQERSRENWNNLTARLGTGPESERELLREAARRQADADIAFRDAAARQPEPRKRGRSR